MSAQLATHEIAGVRPPVAQVYRVTVLGAEPFASPLWAYAGSNRFDDPYDLFRVIYCASDRAGAFGETLARYRRSSQLLALMREVDDEDESLEDALDGLIDPSDERRGIIPFDWRFKREIGATILDPSLEFAEIVNADTIAYLRTELSPMTDELRLNDFDLSSIFSTERDITQHAARSIYDMCHDDGTPRFAGIAYPSRLNPAWTCWALFDDRVHGRHQPQFLETTIDIHDPGFREAARLLDLSFEAVRGHGNFIKP